MTDDRTGVCRVQVYVGGSGADLALPDDVPVGVLGPELWDTLAGLGFSLPHSDGVLTAPGRGPLDPALDLHDNGVRDGTLLVLAAPLPLHRAPQVIDASATVAQRPPVKTTGPCDPRVFGGVGAALLAGVAGFLAVPGAPGLPHALLASAATAAISARHVVTRAGAALVSLSALCTVAALVGTIAELAVADAGVILTVTALALMTVAGRIAVSVFGLSAAVTDPDDLARRTDAARALAAALVVGAAAGVGLGVVATGNSWPVCALAAVTAGVLVLRAREAGPPRTALLIAALCCAATALATATRLGAPPWLTASIACALGLTAWWLGARPGLLAGDYRALDAAQNALLVAAAPLACWALGGYGWIP